jgi:hypothetical protein
MNFNLGNLFAPEYAVYVLPAAGLLAVVLIGSLLLMGRKNSNGLAMPVVDKKRSSLWAMPSGSSLADRRTSVRRDGAPVEIMVTSAVMKDGQTNGYVLDRSTGGLRLALANGVAPGSSMQVRARHAPDTTPWVTVIVRSCRQAESYFELGVEFDKTPPWNVLLLFG